MPAGMPPGTTYEQRDHAPEGVIYFRVYAVLLGTLSLLLVLAGGWSIMKPFFWAPGSMKAGAEFGFWLAGVVYACAGLFFLVPTVVALFGGRRPWVHTLGMLLIVGGMLTVCCIPALIPLLIVWSKAETARWFDGSA
jgi:hypothetical protein